MKDGPVGNSGKSGVAAGMKGTTAQFMWKVGRIEPENRQLLKLLYRAISCSACMVLYCIVTALGGYGGI